MTAQVTRGLRSRGGTILQQRQPLQWMPHPDMQAAAYRRHGVLAPTIGHSMTHPKPPRRAATA
jgi:hypothetical protein